MDSTGDFDIDLRLGALAARQSGEGDDGEGLTEPTRDTCAGEDCFIATGEGATCLDTCDTRGAGECVVVTGDAATCLDTCDVTCVNTCDAEHCLLTADGDTCGEDCFTGGTCLAATCAFSCLVESCELEPKA